MEIRWKLHSEAVTTHVPTLSVPITGDVENKEELKNLLKWGKWQIAKFSQPKKLEIANF